ncbi:Telomere repeat-binding factor 5 [Striga hermonthica]|uniref:MYB transcription factor n=1 Tax=Striga hermonthica TaxID=68872 RepID=A0A9N7R7L2_STRHE|nr:Telomere repeat-binding factor 5 [Striga hermonthica]
MGNRKLKWTAEEEEALMAGIAKHGAGKWKTILVDAEFADILSNRSNVDLKDKWRNIGANHGQDSNVITPKNGRATATSMQELQTKMSPHACGSKDNSNGKSPLSPQEVNDAPKLNSMILEAISTFKDGRGSDFGAILGFIERKYEVPQGFRRSLISKLRRLVSQGTLEKVYYPPT